MKPKLKISLVCSLIALIILVGSITLSTIAYFSDRSTGWEQTYRLPNTSYQVGITYADGSVLKDLSAGGTDSFILKIKNTGNVPMVFKCEYVYPDSSTSIESITIEPDKEKSLTKSFTTTDITTLTEAIKVSVKPESMLDESDVSYTFDGNKTSLYLYAK